ncbi:glycogen/starch/alpha-glucan phosphorylase [Pseudomonas oryzihabitans]|uniref:Alpha-1,4 glucan phosphorylase n=1 Tax=Pseudomonas oryzihabitans TaxID=47885 RepID=A0ABX3IX09_9PSED|nr:glycogen/starch/alpha-glucan phosphorylase [Pseudomonas psychrotolerans]ONN72355.1 glycogen phosphorylase [Pseudomonas psychrotolerans]
MTRPRFISPNEVSALRTNILSKLTYAVGKDPDNALDHDWFQATALAARDYIVDRWMSRTRDAYRTGQKRVYYLSLEFLIGRLLIDSLSNLGILEETRRALADLGVDLERIRGLEPDAALGNGGLGRLAACFMESMATLGIASHGYGIRYEHGLFRQVIADGFQLEQPENWLDFGNPWEFERAEVVYEIGFGGHVAPYGEDDPRRQVWTPGERIRAVAYDTPVIGWGGEGANTLRLWRARPLEILHLETFNAGDHVGAVANEARAESISRVLYPADSSEAGQELRLRQEYFFVAASLADLTRRHLKQHSDLLSLPEHVSIQLNDTHPAIAVAELMRLLVDVHGIPWDAAWSTTVGTLSYTNHTLLPEALETWPVQLMERLLPRHMQIIYLINAQFLDSLRARGETDGGMISYVSLIDESQGRRVRMGNLAFLGSHSINGVSGLHTDLMRKTVFRSLHRLYPDRINNKTNGITFRRWLHQANPALTDLLVDTLGQGVLHDPEKTLPQLKPYANDSNFRERFALQRQRNKDTFTSLVKQRMEIDLDPNALFDVQIKRIHEYKRQLMNLLQTIALYQAIRDNPNGDWTPRVKIFAGKAAASYHQAKLIIKLANDVAKVVNNDPLTRDLLKVVFLPNYNVSLAEVIIPAADLSEQISTAGMEASGTSNMKFGLNGALTIGTLDGANVEMCELIGEEHMFIFGLKAAEVEERQRSGGISSDIIENSPRLAQVLAGLRGGQFSPEDPARYNSLLDVLTWHDRFLVCADFDAYWEAQRQVETRWQQPDRWWQSAVINTSSMGWFSSDRTIREYATEIWKAL